MQKIKFIITSLLFVLPLFVFAQGKNIDRVVAVVGDKPILYSEIETQRISALAQGINLGPNAHERILDELLYQYLLLHHALVDSVEVSETQIQNELEGRVKYFEMQIGGRAKLEEFYGKSIAEIKEEFHEMIREKLLIQAMERKINENTKVTPAEVRAYFAKIPSDSLPFIGSQVEIAHITIVPKVSEQEKLAVREKLDKVRKDIIADKTSFCIEAFNSDDPGSKAKCGELGWVQRGTLVPEFDAQAFTLKDGEYSEVFETSYGFHFMQLKKRRGDEYEARHILYIPKVSAITLLNASKKLDSVYNDIKAGKITFEKAASDYSSDDESKRNGGKMINPQTGDTKFDISELDPQMYITIDRLKTGEYSKPSGYTSPDGKPGYRIIKLISRSDPHKANLHDDYQLIMFAAQRDKEDRMIEAWIKSKIPVTYIHVAEEFRNYKYTYPWIKEQ